MPPKATSRQIIPAPTSAGLRLWNTETPPRTGWSCARIPHSPDHPCPACTPPPGAQSRRVRVIPRIPHAQRREDILAHELLIAAASDLLDQIPQQQITRVAI